MDAKKKKTLIACLIVCCVIAIGALSAAIILKHSSASPAHTTVQTDIATTKGNVAGEEYVKDENRKEYEAVSSSNIKGDPDAKIKAVFYNKVKEASPDLVLESFDLIKTYDAFRFYDTTGTTKAEGKQNYLLVIYAENGIAKIAYYETYDTTEQRADLLTGYIKELDSDYERFALEAKKLDGEYVLYE